MYSPIVFHSKKELENFNIDEGSMTKYFTKYNDDFFKNNSLVLIGILDNESCEYGEVFYKNEEISIFTNQIVTHSDKQTRKGILLVEVNGKVSKKSSVFFSLKTDESPKKDNEYKISEYSYKLNVNTVERIYYTNSSIPQPNLSPSKQTPENLSRLKVIEEKDYYTCGYINLEKKELLDNIVGIDGEPFSEIYSGK